MDNNESGPEPLITVAEAARRLGRSIEQVRRYLREGRLPGRRIGQQWFIEEAALGNFRYPPAVRQGRFIREPNAMLEVGKQMGEEEIKAVLKRIGEHREAIRKRLGGHIGIDAVELIRAVREEH